MPYRYRLIDAEGTDLGPFVSKVSDWKPGDRLGRSKGEDMLITAEASLSPCTWSRPCTNTSSGIGVFSCFPPSHGLATRSRERIQVGVVLASLRQSREVKSDFAADTGVSPSLSISFPHSLTQRLSRSSARRARSSNGFSRDTRAGFDPCADQPSCLNSRLEARMPLEHKLPHLVGNLGRAGANRSMARSPTVTAC
jgi:hypothetical protein